MDFQIVSGIVKNHLLAMRNEMNRIQLTSKGSLEEIQPQLPLFQEQDISTLLRLALPILKEEPVVLESLTPCIVVGALHGSIFDLYQIIYRFGLPPTRSYCFLGNFINSGEFSLEVATFLLALKVVYPRSIFLLKGKSEFENEASKHGFLAEIVDTYSTKEIFDQFIACFNQLPVAAVFFNSVFCVSGGISPGFRNVIQLKSLTKPLTHSDSTDVLKGIFHSEPSNAILEFRETSTGYKFGQESFQKFMNSQKLSLFVRGKDHTNSGICRFFSQQLISLFSASNYKSSNSVAGVLALFGQNDYKVIQLGYLQKVSRSEVVFNELTLNTPQPQKKVEAMTLPRFVLGQTTRKTQMHILETSRNSIPTGHPILTLCNGGDKLSHIARVRTYGTSRPAISRLETFY